MQPPDFCRDDELGYDRSRTPFVDGEGLTLDEAYRLAHLPLVAPDHPKVIASRPGTSYRMGRHDNVVSLVLPVPAEALLRSEAYRELEGELKNGPLNPKIAWDAVRLRQDKLHATVAGSLAVGDEPASLETGVRDALRALGPVHVELRGLFSGNVNLGRLYLKAYPERRDGRNTVQQLQRILSRRETDLYVVGLYNLTDDLTASEARWLDGLVRRWWDRPILQFQADHLWLMSATDDLVLDSRVIENVALT
ncbi:hypothetical protein [Microvirga pudoricolor]|uniref:hypothetical protein n=1 Tax=Microvirga pudoricolor TaxID=2778729 RepID=UPI0019515CD6|nr:hypothetical protein [Microvirga pudoricolor]MBM6594463.1 hypothetical protein [Microvirga pudoricolor]